MHGAASNSYGARIQVVCHAECILNEGLPLFWPCFAWQIGLLQDSNQCAIHAHRVTIKPKDLQLAVHLRRDVAAVPNS